MSAPPLPPPDTLSLSNILARQQELEDEAREVLPGDTTICSFDQNYVRQAVYACKTCNPETTAGFCFACSISCHGEHEIIELFPKRHFKCDCPTSKFANHPCSLPQSSSSSSSKLPPNELNAYDHNFLGRFCICDADYDPQEEAENMVQCIACEDWFHESHLNLIPPPSSTPTSTSAPSAPPPSIASELQAVSSSSSTVADVQPPASTPALPIPEEDESTGPSPLLTEDDYTNIICERCVLAHPVLLDFLGKQGFMTVLQSSGSSGEAAWEVLGRLEEKLEVGESAEVEVEATKEEGSSRKRELGASTDLPSSKKIKLSSPAPTSSPTITTSSNSSSSGCSVPSHPPHLAALIASRRAAEPSDHGFRTGRLDMFLPEDFRERWCRCEKHLPQLASLPYLLEEEETWEPADEAPQPDIEALLLASLSSLPREKTIDVITGFQELTAGLGRYLAKAGEEPGKVIGRKDVETFFEKWKRGER